MADQKIKDVPVDELPAELCSKENVKRLYNLLDAYNNSLNNSYKIMKVLSLLPRDNQSVVMEADCMDIIDEWLVGFTLTKELIHHIDNNSTIH